MLNPAPLLIPAVLATLATAAATPVLPAPAVAAQAVREALAPEVAPAPVTVPAPVARPQATPVQAAAAQPTPAQARAQAIEQAQTVLAQSARQGRSVVARATAYNSLAAQTDSTPFITATGTRTRPGVVALSRDLLRLFPYGSRVTIEDLSGKYNHLLRGRVFYVEDTMAARKTNSIDIWMSTRSQALQFGARQVRITAVR
ncbi:3D (Asp-Asp-Asp) domain-containing protein [Deinococcus sp. HSC-46F16]|uniref:3D domain-containing protein n=1 Tax=Deinococcus sp. HSC-46F16 TaxID=2910968 RepID=UPI00209EDFAD|nr:3D domain-containing protein [Deinococcus sp. HSC-46F16]MCP2013436.1 3D (Asp-Asp-Asp) domain-containing protein [Deinococcus sp. HSC-46F16]